MTTGSRGARLRPGDVLEVQCHAGVAFVSYLGKDDTLGDAIWVVPRMVSSGTFPCSVFGSEGYVTFYPATTAVRRGLVRKVGYCPEALRLLPRRRRAMVNINPDGTVRTWLIQGAGAERTAVEHLTAELRALPVASIWNHPLLVQRIEVGWTPAALESLE